MFFNQFLKFIEKENLFSLQEHILLAVSGGIDSMVMCSLFEKAGFNYSIAHVNHKSRGKSSDLDQHFVEGWAQDHHVPFYGMTLIPEEYNIPGINFQEYARNKRYAWFDKLIEEHHFAYVATAHHKDDSIESALINFASGTGLSGVIGINAKRDRIIRPLMFATKTEIGKYADQFNVPYRKDASNDSLKYRRNAVRHQIVKKFKEIFPSFNKTAIKSIENFKNTDQLLQEFIAEFESKWLKKVGDKTIISRELILEFTEAGTLLYYLLKPYGFNSPQIIQILQENRTGAIFYSATFELLIDRNEWVIKPKEIHKMQDSIVIEGPGFHRLSKTEYLEIVEIEGYYSNSDKNVEIVDRDCLKFPLRVRYWQDGDQFQPIGMKGKSKKIQDFLTDNKIDRFSKNNTRILEDQSHIIWAIPLRIDERVKITTTTKRFIQLTYLEHTT